MLASTVSTGDVRPAPSCGRTVLNAVRREAPAIVLALGVVVGAIALPSDLAADGRAALAVTLLAVIGWTLTRIPDTTVAILAAVAMVATGALPGEALEASLQRWG